MNEILKRSYKSMKVTEQHYPMVLLIRMEKVVLCLICGQNPVCSLSLYCYSVLSVNISVCLKELTVIFVWKVLSFKKTNYRNSSTNKLNIIDMIWGRLSCQLSEPLRAVATVVFHGSAAFLPGSVMLYITRF